MQGKVALFTGGSSGIGLTTAGAFARQGVKVVIASRREATAKTALKQLSTLGDVQWLSVDAADGKSAARLMESIMKHARPPRLCFQQWRQRWGAGAGCEDARGGVAQDDRWISDIDRSVAPLRSRRERPRCYRAAECGYELPPSKANPHLPLPCRGTL